MQNTAIKILVFLAVWKRPEITEICFMGLKRLQKVPGFQVKLFAVISEESMIPLCEKYGVDWCITKNSPLGAKKNYGLSQAMRKDFDYMLEIGSDDIIKDDLLYNYSWDRDVMALWDFAVLNTKDGQCKRISKHHGFYGSGRVISKKALESIGNLWPDKIERALDNNSTMILAKKGFLEKRIPMPEPVALGLKSEVNIWPFDGRGTGSWARRYSQRTVRPATNLRASVRRLAPRSGATATRP